MISRTWIHLKTAISDNIKLTKTNNISLLSIFIDRQGNYSTNKRRVLLVYLAKKVHDYSHPSSTDAFQISHYSQIDNKSYYHSSRRILSKHFTKEQNGKHEIQSITDMQHWYIEFTNKIRLLWNDHTNR